MTVQNLKPIDDLCVKDQVLDKAFTSSQTVPVEEKTKEHVTSVAREVFSRESFCNSLTKIKDSTMDLKTHPEGEQPRNFGAYECPVSSGSEVTNPHPWSNCRHNCWVKY